MTHRPMTYRKSSKFLHQTPKILYFMISHFDGWNVKSCRRFLNFYFRIYIPWGSSIFLFTFNSSTVRDETLSKSIGKHTWTTVLKRAMQNLNAILCGPPFLMTSETFCIKTNLWKYILILNVFKIIQYFHQLQTK